jgi:hypothetical protein
MPGIQDFTYFNIGKETVRGTPVAPTWQMSLEGTGNFEPTFNLNFHEGEKVGRRSLHRRVTSMGEDVLIHGRTVNGIGFDDYRVLLSQLKGGLTGVGAGADKTWTCVPSMTAANNPEAYSIDAGDDVQNWRLQYSMLTRFKQSAGLSDLTQVEIEGFSQRASKVAKASPAGNQSVRIPGELWTWKFATTAAGLTGASVQNNLVIDHEIEVNTGLVWDHYQDGNPYGSLHVETHQSGSLKLTVASTAFAITEFYDKLAGAITYVRAKATSPTALGASFYSLQHDMPVLYEEPKIISRERNGVNLYEVSAKLADDLTLPPISSILVCSQAALP